MKYIKAFLFTLLMVFIFFGTIVFVQGVDAAQKIAVVINDAIENENYHILLRGTYQSEDPIIEETIEYDEATILIKGYETIARNEDNELVNYLEMVFIVTEGSINQLTNVSITYADDTEDLEVWLLKYLNLEVYTLVSTADGQNILKMSELYSKPGLIWDSIKLSYDQDGDPETNDIIEKSLYTGLTNDDFTFLDTLNNYYINNENSYPTEDVLEIKLVQDVRIDTTQSLIITAVTTLVIIVLLTYYVYSIRPKRKLGKKKLTTHLQKDLDKLKEKYENETKNN